MKNKFVIMVLFLVIVIIFLTTIGDTFVGYSIYDPSALTLEQYSYPFVKNLNYNSLLIVVSENPTLSELEAADSIAKSLQLTKPLPPKIIKPSQLDSGKHNLILIGDACTNELISSILNTDKCTLNLKKGQGLLKLVNGETSTLIVSGYDLESLNKAANVISNYDIFPLTGMEAIVQGNSDNLFDLSLTQN